MQAANRNPPEIGDLLRRMVSLGASDLHITVGASPTLRVNGGLSAVSEILRLTPADTERMFASIATKEQIHILQSEGEIDFAYAPSQFGRFRVNAFLQRGFVALACRHIPDQIPTLEDLGHPPILKALALRPSGLVLVAGASGSGKSTTLAAMIDLINRTRSLHVITMEDPVEFVHAHRKCIVNQREIPTDSRSFQRALKAALREDPDVILVGEMRDAETIATAITAAETGHLVFATLHTRDAPQAVGRIVDAFAPHQQAQIRAQLAMCLEGVVAQRLLPRKDGAGRVAALEILISTPAVRNLIREGKNHQIISVMQTGVKFGMATMDMALKDLVKRNLIAGEDAPEIVPDANLI